MRKHAKSWIINILIGAIVVVFIFWGVGSFRQQDLTKVATVNGVPISMAEYQEKYRQMYEAAKAQYKDYLDEELLKILNLKKQAVDSLISEHLIFQQAQALGIETTPETLQQEIARTPIFQVDGRFSKRRYQTMLGRFHYTPQQYEEAVARGQSSNQLIRLITSLAKVSSAEIVEYYHFTKDQIDINFLYLQKDKYKDQVKLTDEDIQAYFGKEREKYRVPNQAKVMYLAIRPKDLEGKVQVDDDEMTDYYELNLDKYREPEKVKARHILFRLAPDASPEEVEKVKKKAEAVLDLARKGQDFAKLAEKYSEGPTAKQGGDLGWFAQDQMVKPFSEAAFKAEVGAITDLVRSDFGFHIIKVEDHKPAGTRSFEEAKPDIRRQIVQDKSTDAAADLANQAYEKVSLSQDFEGVAKEMGFEPKTTGFMRADKPLVDAGQDVKFNEVALSLKPGEIGPLVDLADGHYLIKNLESKASYLPELDEVRETVVVDLTDQRAMELARKAAEDFLAQVAKGGEWDKLAEAGGLQSQSTGFFSRNDVIPKIGYDEKIKTAAFALKAKGQTVDKPIPNPQGYYVIRLRDQLPADKDALAKGKDELTRSLLRAKGQSYFYQWLEAVKSKSQIDIEQGLL